MDAGAEAITASDASRSVATSLRRPGHRTRRQPEPEGPMGRPDRSCRGAETRAAQPGTYLGNRLLEWSSVPIQPAVASDPEAPLPRDPPAEGAVVRPACRFQALGRP